jgi:YidC/Oxa1 family membrane protein insertase
MNPQMAMITKVMPVFFGVISLNFPSGLVLYFFASNLWRVGQQEIILRRYAHLRTTGGAIDVKGAATDATSGGGMLGRLRALANPRGPSEPEPEAEPEPPPPQPKPKRSGSKNRKRKR